MAAVQQKCYETSVESTEGILLKKKFIQAPPTCSLSWRTASVLQLLGNPSFLMECVMKISPWQWGSSLHLVDAEGGRGLPAGHPHPSLPMPEHSPLN